MPEVPCDKCGVVSHSYGRDRCVSKVDRSPDGLTLCGYSRSNISSTVVELKTRTAQVLYEHGGKSVDQGSPSPPGFHAGKAKANLKHID